MESAHGRDTCERPGRLVVVPGDVDLTIQGGLGTVTVIIPEGTAARTGEINTESVTVSAGGAWQKSGNEYVLAGTGLEGHRISISVDMGAGRLELRNP